MTAPRRGRPATIDQSTVVKSALELISRVGVDGLTMKALAQELGVTPMAAYRYVDSKAALLELVVDEVLARAAPPATGSWDERLWVLLWSNFEQVSRYPGLADYLYQGTISEPGRRVLEQAVGLLSESGLSSAEARLAFSGIYAYMIGRLVLRARSMERGTPETVAGQGPVPSLAEMASEAHIRAGYLALVAGFTR